MGFAPNSIPSLLKGFFENRMGSVILGRSDKGAPDRGPIYLIARKWSWYGKIILIVISKTKWILGQWRFAPCRGCGIHKSHNNTIQGRKSSQT